MNATATSAERVLIPEGAIGSLFRAVVNNDQVHELHRELMHWALCSLYALPCVVAGLLHTILVCSFKRCLGSLWRRPWRISQVLCSVCCTPKCGQLPRIWLNYSNSLYFFSLGRNLMGAALQQSQDWFSCAISPLPVLTWSGKHVGAWKFEDAFQTISY